MRKIILKSLSLCNFKGEKERTTVFNDDVTTISGANGLGKSRHFDAFVWLLFGKDTLDRKDYEIKTRVNGKELHNVECSVTGVFDIDGETLRLKRSFVEDWIKPRGAMERVFKGNHTECWYNDVPITVTEYTKRIEAIIDTNLFKMITNPTFFVSMPWKKQREQLFEMAGVISDKELIANNPEFFELQDVITQKSIEDYTKEIAATKKRLNEDLKQIQPRIDQTYKMMPAQEDCAALDTALQEVDREIKEVDNAIADINEATRKQNAEEQAKQAKIHQLKTEAQNVYFAAVEKAKDEAFNANSATREAQRELELAQHEITAQKQELNVLQSRIKTAQKQQVDKQELQSELRKNWFDENAKEFSGETTCPTCGQALPEEKVNEAKSMFSQAKAQKLAEITEQGKQLGSDIAGLQTTIQELQNQCTEVEAKIKEAEAVIVAKAKQIEAKPQVKVAEIKQEELPECIALQKQIEQIEATLKTDITKVDISKFQTQKAELNTKRDDILTRINQQKTIQLYQNEIKELEEKGKQIAQQIADIEKQEYTVQEFTKRKIEECEERVNTKFKMVAFRLFDYTIDGNPIETCIPMVNGVVYGSANTADQFNGGIDIINALCDFYGVSAPIFCDNRESVNHLIDTKSQVINLVVTNDKQLTIK
nr:MAG TPA: chromosome partition protein [Caudoviricetes sp.]